MKLNTGTAVALALMSMIWIGRTQPAVVKVPLTLSLTNQFQWTNAVWWTNAVAKTNIETWQAWWSLNENLLRITNHMATNVTARLSNSGAWIGSDGGIAFTTNAAPTNTNFVVWVVFTNANGGQKWAFPAAEWP